MNGDAALSSPTSRRSRDVSVTALAAERPYLHLTREREVAAAVSALDARLTIPPRSPYSSPLEIGKLEKFEDKTRNEHVGYVLHLLGGKRVTVIYPVEIDGDDVADAVSNLADVILAKVELGITETDD